MTANNKLLSALGLCRRAGKLQVGFDAAAGALDKGAPMIVLSCDIAQRTRRNITEKCRASTRIVELSHTQHEFEAAVGKRFVVAAVCDENFARLIEDCLKKANHPNDTQEPKNRF